MRLQPLGLLAVVSLSACGYESKLQATSACEAWKSKGQHISIVREYFKDGLLKVQSTSQVAVRKCIDLPAFRMVLGEVRRLNFPKETYGKLEKPEYKTWVAQRFRY